MQVSRIQVGNLERSQSDSPCCLASRITSRSQPTQIQTVSGAGVHAAPPQTVVRCNGGGKVHNAKVFRVTATSCNFRQHQGPRTFTRRSGEKSCVNAGHVVLIPYDVSVVGSSAVPPGWSRLVYLAKLDPILSFGGVNCDTRREKKALVVCLSMLFFPRRSGEVSFSFPLSRFGGATPLAPPMTAAV